MTSEIATERKLMTKEESAFNGCSFLCDSCNVWLSPSTGRFSCLLCTDFDVCTECMLKGVHSTHALVRLSDADTMIPDENGTPLKLDHVFEFKPRIILISNDIPTT